MASIELFDTHTHMYLDEFASDRIEAMGRAISEGVTMMMLPNVDLSTIASMKELNMMYPQNTCMAMGLHPTEINSEWASTLGKIEDELNSGTKYRAIGEVGMDLYWDKTYASEQAEAFDIQVGWAEHTNLPIIIHCREALTELLDVLDSHKGRLPQMIFHSFGGDSEDIKNIRQRTDAYFGINGIVTFKNSRLKEVLPAIGIDRMLIETDAPYLAPVPYRGRRNESAFIIKTAYTIAAVLNSSIDEIAAQTKINAEQIFGFK